MTKVTKKQAEEALKKGAKNVTEDDLKKILERKEEIEDKFKSDGPLGRFIEDFRLLAGIIEDYVAGNYKEMPWWTIAAIAATLLYVLSPVDLIPDFIPIIGLLDDALVIAVCLSLVEQDLHEYKEWKIKNS